MHHTPLCYFVQPGISSLLVCTMPEDRCSHDKTDVLCELRDVPTLRITWMSYLTLMIAYGVVMEGMTIIGRLLGVERCHNGTNSSLNYG